MARIKPDPLRASVIDLACGQFRDGVPLTETAAYGPGYTIISRPDAMVMKIRVGGHRRGDHPRYFTITVREVSTD